MGDERGMGFLEPTARTRRKRRGHIIVMQSEQHPHGLLARTKQLLGFFVSSQQARRNTGFIGWRVDRPPLVHVHWIFAHKKLVLRNPLVKMTEGAVSSFFLGLGLQDSKYLSGFAMFDPIQIPPKPIEQLLGFLR